MRRVTHPPQFAQSLEADTPAKNGYNEFTILTDDQADPSRMPSRQNIVNGMRWLVDGVQPGDRLFFH